MCPIYDLLKRQRNNVLYLSLIVGGSKTMDLCRVYLMLWSMKVMGKFFYGILLIKVTNLETID